MTAVRPAPARRRRWHPVTAGSGLLVAALAVAAATLAPGGWLGSGGWLPSGSWLLVAGWLLVGASAGFATSGST